VFFQDESVFHDNVLNDVHQPILVSSNHGSHLDNVNIALPRAYCAKGTTRVAYASIDNAMTISTSNIPRSRGEHGKNGCCKAFTKRTPFDMEPSK
jgi:hypothetical protein